MGALELQQAIETLELPRFLDVLGSIRRIPNKMGTADISVALLSNVTVAHFIPVLRFHFQQNGLSSEVSTGGYNTIEYDMQSFARDFPHVIIIWEIINETWGLQYKYDAMGVADRELLRSTVLEKARRIFSTLKSDQTCYLNRFTCRYFETNPLEPDELERTIEEINNEIAVMAPMNVVFLNPERILTEISIRRARNLRDYFRARVLHSYEFSYRYSEIVSRLILNSIGRQRKLLILDCDNTLWGGLCGELGVDVILDAVDAPGVVYYECQHIIRTLVETGVAIALCSKNNERDVWEVFDHQPSMVLRRDDIACARINWQDKVDNIVSIANEMRLGLESVVFVDDSPHETANVKTRLPMVRTVCVPETLEDYPGVLRRVREDFQRHSSTSEDKYRTKYYKAEEERKTTVAEYASYEEYLASLGQSIMVFMNDRSKMDRVQQLIEKTNQFNATTVRYSRDILESIYEDEETDVYCFDMRDRFGEMGVVGVAIILNDFEHQIATLDSFIMSCRVIGKTAEYAFFYYIAEALLTKNVQRIVLKYRRTEKNAVVQEMMRCLSSSAGKERDGVTEWVCDINDILSNRHSSYVRID